MLEKNMMRSKPKAAAFVPAAKDPDAEKKELEVRPGGMLVQRRDPDADADSVRVPTIRVKVKYAGVYHEIYISSQASFGELKKALSARTGLHPDDQKLVFKDKERDSKAFLDISGIKDRSKIVLLEDPTAKAKRLLEMRRTDKLEKAARSISRISLEVDKLASKVSALETIVSKGGKVVENDVIHLTELLMNELVKLDAIVADGEVKVQWRIQVKRVQRYVEMLDAIKAKNATAKANEQAKANGQANQQQQRQFQPPRQVVVTTKWETFDLLSSMPSTSSATSTTSAASIASSTPTPRSEWELLLSGEASLI
ncbi:BAG family molecular chaperone regulator 1-like [Typha angustifolia]|uniref:BAG family molecular chaperone regulator 1-like n=1 Tax=Typha angustifolia TaxID=59011 RepID=UPI003C2CBB67